MTDVRQREDLPAGDASGEGTTSTRTLTTVIGVLVFAALLMILNETVLSVALPQLMQDFSVTASTAQWLTTGFMLTMAVVIPTTGFMLQRFTTRTLFLVAITLFLVGTALAVVAPTFAIMLLARIVQAAGTAVVLPLLMTTTISEVPVQHRGTVMGLNSVVISVAPAVGPTLAGIVVDALSWRWLFGIMLVLGVLVFGAGFFFVRIRSLTRNAPLDVPSIVISVFAFGGVVYGLANIGTLVSEGALTPVVSLIVGILALALFVTRQQKLAQNGSALLDLKPFTSPTFRVSVGIVVACMATMLGTVIVLPIYFQSVLGLSVLTTGLLLLPGGLVQGVISPIVGSLYDRVGPRPLLVPGALLLAGGQWSLTQIGTDTAVGLVVAMHVMFCIGMAMLMTPLMTLSLGSLPPRLYGHGSAIMNTLQQLAGAAGIAVLVAAMTIGAEKAGAPSEAGALASGMQTAFVVGGCIALVAVVLAPFVRAPGDRSTPEPVDA
ncbi:MDR family MFS transporter [Rhodococcus sp. CH91]|uniref:MDR family MFS transporter n=1 Tax=Rhodococcus sp. CH91 TaxID=2910256 RepID=UPI001F4B12A9|nr:MDR family MFS transporter [Rhodococcus sp. CH91]